MQQTFLVRDGVECLVGWDSPMQTFFGQVYKVDSRGERTDDEPLLWVGTHQGEIHAVEELARLLRAEKASIPSEIYGKLYAIEVD